MYTHSKLTILIHLDNLVGKNTAKLISKSLTKKYLLDDPDKVFKNCWPSSVSNDNCSSDIPEHMWARCLDRIKVATRIKEKKIKLRQSAQQAKRNVAYSGWCKN